ncbi:MAG TPA: ABC transporter permease, partial [Longimicrobium sp.]|nr:ABC transporter permease [Longimicrobium sp.]
MILRLALAELRNRPGRALFLLAGYALGVAVMVVLLAVGEAMLEQARDRELVGGGDVVVVPAGISAEMLKAGGVSSLFLGIDHARFLQRNLLESPRGMREHGVRAASPILDGKPVELYAGGRRIDVIATGEIPSRSRAAGASPNLLSGRWMDSDADRGWTAPGQAALLREIDRFHIPPVRDSTWAEWHYFNVVLDEDRWVYATMMVAGEVGVPGRWGGRILLTVREPDGTHR